MFAIARKLSHWDTLDRIDYSAVASAALVTARAAYMLAGGTETDALKIAVNATLVSELLQCISTNWNCPLMQPYIASALQHATAALNNKGGEVLAVDIPLVPSLYSGILTCTSAWSSIYFGAGHKPRNTASRISLCASSQCRDSAVACSYCYMFALLLSHSGGANEYTGTAAAEPDTVWSDEHNGIYLVPSALEMFIRAYMSEKLALTSGSAYSGATCSAKAHANECGICTVAIACPGSSDAQDCIPAVYCAGSGMRAYIVPAHTLSLPHS
eukprot:16142-Heterococcus_DN1.PRE.4